MKAARGYISKLQGVYTRELQDCLGYIQRSCKGVQGSTQEKLQGKYKGNCKGVHKEAALREPPGSTHGSCKVCI